MLLHSFSPCVKLSSSLYHREMKPSCFSCCPSETFSLPELLLLFQSKRTYVQDDVIHAKLRFLLQSSQGLRVLITQVSIQSKPGSEPGAVIQSSEHEHVTPALITPTVVHWHHTEANMLTEKHF